MESLGAKRSIRSSLSGAGFLTPSLPLSRGYAALALRAVCVARLPAARLDEPSETDPCCLRTDVSHPKKPKRRPRQREIAKNRQGSC
jgi:hypothetical protein